jgi:hypothetical protein
VFAAVAQVVERSPEKAGVGGSTPSRGTMILTNSPDSSIPAWGQKGTISKRSVLVERCGTTCSLILGNNSFDQLALGGEFVRSGRLRVQV